MWNGAVLFLLIALATAIRLQGITRSLEHDEVYTWAEFASRPWLTIPRTYTAPNNHIFHSLCVKASTALLGTSEWAMRLPALAAGVMGVAAVFFLALALTRMRPVAWLTAALLTILPAHIGFSRQARGYSLLLLFGICFSLCLVRGMEDAARSWRWWMGAALAGFLAVLTVPSGVYLVFSGLLWAGGTMVVNAAKAEPKLRRGWLLKAGSLAAVTGLLIGALLWVYLPLYDQLLANSRTWGIPLQENYGKIGEVIAGAGKNAGPVRWPLVGLAFGLLGVGTLLKENRRLGTHILMVGTIPFAINLVSGMAGPSRVYSFMIPLALVAVARGVWDSGRFLLHWGKGKGAGLASLPVASILALYISPTCWNAPAETHYRHMGRYLVEHTRPEELVVIPYIMDASFGYYTRDLQRRRIERFFSREQLGEMLFVGRSTGPRYALDDYLLTTNFLTAAADYQDRYRQISLPEDGFTQVRAMGNLVLYRPREPAQEVWLGAELAEPENWRIYYQSERGIRLSAEAGWGGEGRKKLSVRTPPDLTFVLHTRDRFQPPGRGILLLRYAKSVGDNSLASLYAARDAEGDEGIEALQMVKIKTQTVVLAEEEREKRRFGEVYLIPVQADKFYGIYIFGSGSEVQYFGDWGLFYIPL